MKPLHHVAVSAAVSVGFWQITHSWLATAMCFLSGIFVDLDHHLDCYLGSGRFPFKYKDLVNFCRNEDKAKLYLFFHSYELLFLLWGAITLFELGAVWIGVLLGMTVHIVCDDIVNPLRPVAYFFFYRLYHKFERRKLYAGWMWDELH